MKAVAKSRRQRKTMTFAWIAALCVVVISLIYWEKTAILYILATFGVTALLVVVAMSDLRHAEKISTEVDDTSRA
jgi:FtsH-binding integral membrane protein